jgi:leader peptidase (prepilin peptidase)/N-methyltransferase
MLLPWWTELGIAGIFGLLVGSFLNVVIYRLPKMMERQWAADCAELSGTPSPKTEVFNLVVPRSRCQHCGQTIGWLQNIPVFSYLLLRGQCKVCKSHISARYPAIELLTAGFFVLAANYHGLSWIGLAWAVFSSILIAQFFIDLDTQILPDDLNYLLLWTGLAVAALGWTIPPRSSVLGAIAGYLSLWLVYHAYRLLTHKEGMGYGDFKLLAALGAWLGFEYLLTIILLSSLVGAVIGASLLISGKLADKNIPIAFGPFLAGAGLLCLALGPGRLEQLVPFAFPFSHLIR